MVDDSLFFKVKTIGLSTCEGRKPQSLLDAVRHNRRHIQAELGPHGHIDPNRTHRNRTLTGADSPEGVALVAQTLMAGIGHKPERRDYTQAQELVFSLPANTSIDNVAFFNDCLDWTAGKFGRQNILSGDAHGDEGAWHLHVLVAPIRDGRYMGSALITRKELYALRESFAALALTYGLREPVKRLKWAQRESVAKRVLDHLALTGAPVMADSLWPVFKADIESNPGRYAAALGISDTSETMHPVKRKPVVKGLGHLAARKGAGPKFEGKRKAPPYTPNPIGIEPSRIDDVSNPIGIETGGTTDPAGTPENINPNALLGLPAKAPHSAPEPALIRHHLTSPQPDPEVTRTRDDATEAGQWCEELGDFIRTAPSPSRAPPRAAHPAGGAWVSPGSEIRSQSPIDDDHFSRCDQTEEIEAWAD